MEQWQIIEPAKGGWVQGRVSPTWESMQALQHVWLMLCIPFHSITAVEVRLPQARMSGRHHSVHQGMSDRESLSCPRVTLQLSCALCRVSFYRSRCHMRD